MRPFIYIVALQVLISTVSLNCFAQDNQRTIYGKVISFEESFPLKDVRVSVKGVQSSTSTQSDGTFSLKISSDDKVIVISLDGYEIKEISLTKAAEYNIVLTKKGST